MTDLHPFSWLQKRLFLKDKLKSIHQEHVLDYWSELSINQQNNLLHQIANIDIDFFHEQRQLLKISRPPLTSFSPLSMFSVAGEDANWKGKGLQLLKEKKVGCIVLAGGQGSRLNYNGPKGCYPISKIKKKSLFQLIAEKVLAASRLANQPLPLAIMTSPINDAPTRSFFSSHQYFGLQTDQIDFFCQPMWPLLSYSGDLFLEEKDHIACGPTGNGCVANVLYTSKIWEKWSKIGIEMVCIIPIDNPLALPFDLELCGFHANGNQEVTIKATDRLSPLEEVGLLVQQHPSNQTSIIEYSEISKEERSAVNSCGQLKYNFANIGLYCVSMSFLHKTATTSLPIYNVLKQVKQVDAPHKQTAWKFEEFIFDLFKYSDTCKTLIFPREECFAPLKNHTGPCSPETVQAALSIREKNIFRQLTGKCIDTNAVFELEADFYYPSSTALSPHWEGKAVFEEPFVEAS